MGGIHELIWFLFSLNKLKNKKKIKRAKNLNRHFLQKSHKDSNRYLKRFSTSLIIRGLQINITMRYHSYPLEWLLSERQEITSVGEYVDKREPLYIVGENIKVGTTIMENSANIPQN